MARPAAMPRRLEGKLAVVTAATAGIGLGIARRLAQEGAAVMISSRKQRNVDDTVAALRQEGLDVRGVACHVGSLEQCQHLIKAALQEFGRQHLDILVSNAAVNPAGGPILQMDDKVIDKILEINVRSAIWLTREAAKHMTKGGSIIFNSSFSAFNPMQPLGMYAVSKTTILGLTKALAAELGSDGVRVNCIAPGFVPTKFASSLLESDEARRANEDMTLIGRLGTPQEMAAAVAFLASDDSSYVTAETLVVAGGMQSRL
jgi:dehydrogenase/reductase SDR family protein 4